jgi:hypothetical protein
VVPLKLNVTVVCGNHLAKPEKASASFVVDPFVSLEVYLFVFIFVVVIIVVV